MTVLWLTTRGTRTELAVGAMPTMVTVTNTPHAPQYRCTRRSVTGHSPVLRVDPAATTAW